MECLVCSGSIPKQRGRPRRIYCSERCARAADRRNHANVNPKKYPGMITSRVGTMAEIDVIRDLLIRGYEVYRAVCASSPCDLAVVKDGRLVRVEVTTGHYTRTGAVKCPPKDPKNFDVLAAVTHKQIHYIPDLS